MQNHPMSPYLLKLDGGVKTNFPSMDPGAKYAAVPRVLSVLS